MDDVLEKLSGGDRRSIGRSEEVVADVLDHPELFDAVFEGMLHDDPLIRMRSADAVEKITKEHPEHLLPYKDTLIDEVARIDQQEVRWHFAQMVTRLDLDAEERARVFAILCDYLGNESKIVQTLSMQALADLAEADEALLPRVARIIEELVDNGSPAVRSRGRKLLSSMRERGLRTSQGD